LVAAPVEAPTGERFSPATWVKIAVFAGLLGAVHHWQLPLLVGIWRRDLNWSHGFLIPLFSLYLLYARREELRAAPRRICLWGLPILIFGLIWQILAYYPVRNNWLTFLSMTVILFGLVLYLAGPQVIRLTWVPIFFLAFAMPLPKRLYTQIALPLQEFAALASTILLRIFGTEIEVTKSHLTIAGRSGAPYELTVAEACSGVRSLMAFVAIGVAIAYLENRPTWQRVILVIMTIPIAILINVIRVSITGTMYVIDRPELGQKFMHEFLGMVMLIPAFLLLWALGWLLQHLLIEEEEQPLETQPPGEGAKT
jgi:exosortase